MLQALLAERFKLAMHRESKEQPVYAIVIGKGALKINRRGNAEACARRNGTQPGVTGSNSVSITQGKGGATVSDGTGKTQKMIPSPDGKTMRLEITRGDTRPVAEGLIPMTDHPVVDMTGLTGKYEMTLDISMQELMNAARAAGATYLRRPWIRPSRRMPRPIRAIPSCFRAGSGTEAGRA